jgi:predicted phosphodiesterase
LKFVAIADTHGMHAELTLPPGDVLVHAGDVSMKGHYAEIINFLDWFAKQDFEYKIFIAGNHDFYFEKEADAQIEKIIPEGVVYLKDSGTKVNDIKIWGSPVTPWFFDWAFNRHRGEPIRRHWDLIPPGIDILITHGPMFGTLDSNKSGQLVGCKDLFNRINEIDPKVHVFGHIHEAYGQIEKKGIEFINASVLDEKYKLKNQPIIFEL